MVFFGGAFFKKTIFKIAAQNGITLPVIVSLEQNKPFWFVFAGVAVSKLC